MPPATYTPGSLVHARGRDWIVLSGSDAEILHLRPVSGSEEDHALLHLALEGDSVRDASFPLPPLEQRASHDSALLLRDALQLSLRRGAGPFRSFGQIAVEPRAYQLVPLLMALKLDPVRLLIADDVGVGKTIEAALIARELLDRGDINRIAVLCPPHLVEQWCTELEERFHIHAVPVTSASASRLERDLPPSVSVFSAFPFTVVSLDYIKSDKRRADFLRACPEFVIVDEAHTCAATGQGRHQRYDLLKGLTESPDRHLVLLTATPHSGDEAAFYRLLSLLDRDFADIPEATDAERLALRNRLSRHFVQRRRPDIAEWSEGNLFPKRETTERTYKLTGEWERFFQSVLEYCRGIVELAHDDERRQRMNFWSTLALMRCVASSPAAAVLALRTRAGLADPDDSDGLRERVFDGAADALSDDDLEPSTTLDAAAVFSLILQAEHLVDQTGDPKLKVLIEHLQRQLDDGFSPVIFCRYIATANYLYRHLQTRFKGVTVSVITGELTAEERRDKVDTLVAADRRLLIATDCLSEGVNLQAGFDAVVHYDLSWNPTRHEQREGRVDRFGQKSKVVRATLMYGANNPVDGAVLEVILRKAEKIRAELGVPVPLPDDGHTLTQALLKAVLLRHAPTEGEQIPLFKNLEPARNLDHLWTDAADRARRNRTVFAQHRLKPEDVLPEWRKTLAAMGGATEVHRFLDRALARLGSGLEALKHGYKAPLAPLPEDVRERLDAEGLSGTLWVDVAYPPAPRCYAIQRSHPLISVLAETLLERTLSANPADTELGDLGRTGCWVSAAVDRRTTVVLLRCRHQLMTQYGHRTTTVLVEEATGLAWASGTVIAEADAALALLLPPPLADVPEHVRLRILTAAREQIPDLAPFAQRRADALLADHARVRASARSRGTTHVQPMLPPDVIALFVLLPKVD